ncbi:MAG: two-component sensor histidine kinase, partial [Cellulomonadaceae bacterium]|nr:two-component sensor histidine kinase [Cellulomonadaceae bacterium]
LDRLEGASARQRSFVADAAHELRSPIAALRATLDVARTHPDSYAPGELVEELAGETARMQVLVDDLLLLARVGSRPLRATRVDLREVVEQVLAAPGAPWMTVVPGRSVASGPGGVTVQVIGEGAATADAAALARAVRNLVENAARHATSTVQVTLDEGRVVVDDDGPGIAEQDRERVFERFVRLDDSRQRGAGGAGLGLAIARELAREQGGDVRLERAATGGLSAVLTLPPGRTLPRPGVDFGSGFSSG